MYVGIFLRKDGGLARRLAGAEEEKLSAWGFGNALGVAHACEAGPANVGAIGEVLHQVFGLAQLVEHGRAPDARFQGGGSHGDLLCERR
jgi:hypothetical protein